MNLQKIQQAYSQAIYQADTDALESLIHGSTDFTTRKRVDIYRNNTLGTLKQTLADTYPVCEMLVGTRYFKQLSTAHVRQYPSIDRNLDHYGSEFSQTLQQLIQQREELKALAYLADIAQLEWLLHQSYYAPNRRPFDFEQFSTLNEEQQTQIVFKLADDIRLMESPHSVYDIWISHQNPDKSIDKNTDKNIDKDEEHEIVQVTETHNYIMVQRDSWQSQALLIDKTLYELLNAIKLNMPLSKLADYLEKSPMDIATLIQQGFITGFTIDKESSTITNSYNKQL